MDTTIRWSLDDLYEGFNERFKSDMAAFKKDIEEMKAYVKSSANQQSFVEGFIKRLTDLAKYRILTDYCQLTLSTDTENIEALGYLDVLNDIASELAGPEALFAEYIKNTENIDLLIESSPILKAHGFYLQEIKSASKHMLSEKEELIIAKMRNTGSSYWLKLYDQLMGGLSCEINIDGEEKSLSLSEIRNMAHDENREKRKLAYSVEIKACEKIALPVSACLNAIKGEAITVSKLKGYESVLHMTLEDSRMEKDTLSAMLSAMEESMEGFQRYFAKKAALLGLEESLQYYDLFAPVGQASLSLSYNEAMEFIIEKFSAFSEDLGAFARKAYESKWLDPMPRKGKVGGAFCADLHPIKQCRIMSNFQEGSFDSVLTLAHELGHGYHGSCLNDELPLNTEYSMPIAETASTFCETLICFEALKTAEPDHKLIILENYISGCAQVIVDIYSRFIFEDALIKRREDGSLSVNELNALMKSSIKKAYGKALDEDSIHSYMWLIKPHYYDSASNYYNFPYAYGHLFSLGLYNKYLEEGPAFADTYKKLLAATGKNSLRDVGLLCGIDVNNKEFWKNSLNTLLGYIEDFSKL